MTKKIDTGTSDLLAALDEGVLTLTLNRPEARNAMSEAMNRALAATIGLGRVGAFREMCRAHRRRQGILRGRRRQGDGRARPRLASRDGG